MTHASSFTGLGIFDLAAERIGFENIFQCEIDSFCQKLLKQNFKKIPIYNDIRTTDFTIYKRRVDVFTGGFPCKQTSIAAAIHGKRIGLIGVDSGLWYEQLRAFTECRSTWVVVENVAGIKKWEDTIQAGLAGIGYTVSRMEYEAFDFGLPHKRKRYFYVGNANGQRLEVTRSKQPPSIEWFKRLAINGGAWLSSSPGVTGSLNGLPYRVDRVKAIGNAICYYMAEDVLKTIFQYENQIK